MDNKKIKFCSLIITTFFLLCLDENLVWGDVCPSNSEGTETLNNGQKVYMERLSPPEGVTQGTVQVTINSGTAQAQSFSINRNVVTCTANKDTPCAGPFPQDDDFSSNSYYYSPSNSPWTYTADAKVTIHLSSISNYIYYQICITQPIPTLVIYIKGAGSQLPDTNSGFKYFQNVFQNFPGADVSAVNQPPAKPGIDTSIIVTQVYYGPGYTFINSDSLPAGLNQLLSNYNADDYGRIVIVTHSDGYTMTKDAIFLAQGNQQLMKLYKKAHMVSISSLLGGAENGKMAPGGTFMSNFFDPYEDPVGSFQKMAYGNDSLFKDSVYSFEDDIVFGDPMLKGIWHKYLGQNPNLGTLAGGALNYITSAQWISNHPLVWKDDVWWTHFKAEEGSPNNIYQDAQVQQSLFNGCPWKGDRHQELLCYKPLIGSVGEVIFKTDTDPKSQDFSPTSQDFSTWYQQWSQGQ